MTARGEVSCARTFGLISEKAAVGHEKINFLLVDRAAEVRKAEKLRLECVLRKALAQMGHRGAHGFHEKRWIKRLLDADCDDFGAACRAHQCTRRCAGE